MDTALTALLCICSWISASVSEFHTVEVQPGEEVILLCNNFTKTPAFITWFKMDSRPGATCIASLWNYDANVSLYVGFPKGEFNMTSNMTTIFLHIKHVNFSDSGLHFCGSTWANKTEMLMIENRICSGLRNCTLMTGELQQKAPGAKTNGENWKLELFMLPDRQKLWSWTCIKLSIKKLLVFL
ncbi:uncharacterized protein LOC115059095 isoform X2 [Echeneis naucrates]|uniref:uncharacterized protein LOC115059095 isoform X2 n=1 Tax=Echeneis naucrates TaxID=173247 RepID=UPI001113CA15|nr:uncharacterized protein LOC115059095 isoform X2 [Echeneis naucrates]